MESIQMQHLTRRTLLFMAVAFPLLSCTSLPKRKDERHIKKDLAKLEAQSGVKLGVARICDGQVFAYRGGDRFPFCSTFKVMLVAAILKKSERDTQLVQRQIYYTKDKMVTYSPITQNHLKDGMSVSQLCAAALQYSDNTAANLLLEIMGGPPEITRFARTIGNSSFRLDRWETDLNTAFPDDERDTSTPIDMAHSLQHLVLGDTLEGDQRNQLQQWLLGNTTGKERIGAGMPASWQIGDKTGTGDYGANNDIAVMWRKDKPPVVLAIYSRQFVKDAKPLHDVVAQAARIVLRDI